MDKIIWFDTHCHLQDEAFAEDRSDVFQRAEAANVQYILLATSSLADSKLAVELALEYRQVYCSIGYHPEAVNEWQENSVEELRELYLTTAAKAEQLGRDNPIKAIGEIGLDYYWDKSQIDLQKVMYKEQIKLAHELNLPLIVHERDAFQDSFEILKQAYEKGFLKTEAGVCHCFSGSIESAERLIQLGFLIGLDGPVTFKNAKRPKEVAAKVDLQKLVLETDSPYLTPEPNRGKRNESSYLPYIGQEIAALRNMSVQEIADQTRENGKRLFAID